MVRAEEYYGRAILANPEDGELLSLYGKLIWETNRDEERAKSYFDQAIHVAPNDRYNTLISKILIKVTLMIILQQLKLTL
jgi:Tfp pilus assembly protein PilF